jgi:hypothetical protein
VVGAVCLLCSHTLNLSKAGGLQTRHAETPRGRGGVAAPLGEVASERIQALTLGLGIHFRTEE